LQISKDDWLEGIKVQRFPVTKHEALKMFNAIDVNKDGCT